MDIPQLQKALHAEASSFSLIEKWKVSNGWKDILGIFRWWMI